jgi:hypothetical protein
MKTIFKLLFFVASSPILLADSEKIIFDVGAGDPTFTQLRADSFANKVIRNSAYLAYTKDTSLKDCWLQYIKNKDISINTKGTSLKILSRDSDFYKYELAFNPESLVINGVSKEQFLNYCKTGSQNQSMNNTNPNLVSKPSTSSTIEDEDLINSIEVKIIFDEKSITDGLLTIPSQITSEDTQIDY